MKRLHDEAESTWERISRYCSALWPMEQSPDPWWLPGELWHAIRHTALMARHWDHWQALWSMARYYSIERWRLGARLIEFHRHDTLYPATWCWSQP